MAERHMTKDLLLSKPGYRLVL